MRLKYIKHFFGAGLLSICLICTVLFFSACARDTNQQVFGVWWWNHSLGEEYLDFAKAQGVNEIYFCDDEFEDASNFIKKANSENIKVFWLIGDYRWLRSHEDLYSEIERYINYNEANPNAKFDGIHLDIEPHQDGAFDEERVQLITSLIRIADYLNKNYSYIHFDFDLPFWLEDEINFDGVTKPAFAHILDRADRIFLMSYRDTAENMLDVSSAELEYSKQINKPVILGAETAESEEGDNITYFEECKTYLNEQLNLLKAELPSNSGISIHHMSSWYNLKDQNG